MGVFLTGISLDPALIACDRVVEMSAEHEDECQSLKQRVAELELIADRLRGEKERAVESDRLKSAFIATMSHELRTPLNSIIGFTGILLQKISGPLTREQEKQLNLVQHSSRHLLALINDILDISKIEAGELRISFDPVNLHQVVEAAVRVVQPLASQKGLSIRTDLATGPVIISGDQRRIEQIVMNLLSNAVKFTDEGYISVGISCEEIDSGSPSTENYKKRKICINVKDPGRRGGSPALGPGYRCRDQPGRDTHPF